MKTLEQVKAEGAEAHSYNQWADRMPEKTDASSAFNLGFDFAHTPEVIALLPPELLLANPAVRAMHEALSFYASVNSAEKETFGAWDYRKRFLFDLICQSDLEFLGGEHGPKKQRYIFGGRRARQALLPFAGKE